MVSRSSYTGNVRGIKRQGITHTEMKQNRKDFESVLRTRLQKTAGLKFSKHALERMEQRRISFSGRQMERIQKAVERAQKKGLKESLVMVDGSALVVSVTNNTVITVADSTELKENIFTNIDGAVFS